MNSSVGEKYYFEKNLKKTGKKNRSSAGRSDFRTAIRCNFPKSLLFKASNSSSGISFRGRFLSAKLFSLGHQFCMSPPTKTRFGRKVAAFCASLLNIDSSFFQSSGCLYMFSIPSWGSVICTKICFLSSALMAENSKSLLHARSKKQMDKHRKPCPNEAIGGLGKRRKVVSVSLETRGSATAQTNKLLPAIGKRLGSMDDVLLIFPYPA